MKNFEHKHQYENPLISRYSSREMQYIFSPMHRAKTWRILWSTLASCQHTCGLPITREQVEAMVINIDRIDFDRIAEIEKETRHDVMAHIQAYGEVAPEAKGVIHLGATSSFVTDNGDLLIYKKALALVRKKLLTVMANLASFADRYKELPTLGYTHFQPAQPVTVGKRASVWLQDFWMDFEEVDRVEKGLKLLGSRGATGTGASFKSLFNGDSSMVFALDKAIAETAHRMGMAGVYSVSGQTYPRKVDSFIQNTLSGIAQSAHRFATDLRLLQHEWEIEEPFEDLQVGSSAMPYKRNPMRSERICSLSRFVITNAQNAVQTASVQWLERTLDDSANRRMSMPEGFLAVDSILTLLQNVTFGLVVNENMIAKNLQETMPFIATENILMVAVKAGGNRQELHEKIRRYSHKASQMIKLGATPSLVADIRNDPDFDLSDDEWEWALDPNQYIGVAPEQVTAFLEQNILPILEREGAKPSGAVLNV